MACPGQSDLQAPELGREASGHSCLALSADMLKRAVMDLSGDSPWEPEFGVPLPQRLWAEWRG